MANIFTILNAVVDTYTPPRTPANCPIRAWAVASEAELNALTGQALVDREIQLRAQLLQLPDWHTIHSVKGIQATRDYGTARKRAAQVQYAKHIAAADGAKAWRIFTKLLREELENPGMLDPKVMLRMQKFVEASGGRRLRAQEAAALSITAQAMAQEPTL